MVKKVVNLTPHEVVVVLENGEKVTFPPSGVVARVATNEEQLRTVYRVPVVKREWGQLENVPEPEEGVFYLVSSVVFEAAQGRKDLLVPDTGKTAVRDEKGQVVAVRRFVGR